MIYAVINESMRAEHVWGYQSQLRLSGFAEAEKGGRLRPGVSRVQCAGDGDSTTRPPPATNSEDAKRMAPEREIERERAVALSVPWPKRIRGVPLCEQ